MKHYLNRIFGLALVLMTFTVALHAQTVKELTTKLAGNSKKTWVPRQQIAKDAIGGDIRYVFSSSDQKFEIWVYSTTKSPGWNLLIGLPWRIETRTQANGNSYTAITIAGQDIPWKLTPDKTQISLKLNGVKEAEYLRPLSQGVF